ncbi:MAG TPA: ABC transporter substrate-binding protein [Caulobacteraceae bacterium]|nr:ABC transporter substrate-binding protein [Caulobacteraceae bacterium]
MSLKSAVFAAALIAVAVPAAALAQASDPAAAQIDAFDNALLQVMKQGKSVGVEGRYRELQPAVEGAFDLATMTRFAVGPKWTTVSPADQAALVKAFTRLSIASYAKNFDSYDGEKFVLNPAVQSRGPDKLVQTQLVSPHDKTHDFAYRMRVAADGRWKVIDVYSDSISSLATRRSDFASTMNAGGAPALVKKIDALADKQLR